MEAEINIRTASMPEDMRILLDQYPRDTWASHEGFKEKTQQWLGAHRGFRRLANLLRTDAEALIDQAMGPEEYARHLSRYGNLLIGNLHGHHSWEDKEYFPELSSADSRFDRGLEILEQDHEDLNGILHTFAGTANRALKLEALDLQQMREEVGMLHKTTQTIETLLDRHLSDEEELAVPIILHYRLRG